MAEEQVMQPNERCNTPSTHFNEPHGSDNPLPPIHSVSAIRRKKSCSKRRRPRSRQKRVQSDPETNHTNLDGYLKKVSSPSEKLEQRFVLFQEQSANDQTPEGANTEADSVPVDITSMDLIAVNRCLQFPILSGHSTTGSSIDVHFQIENFENEWEQQPDSEAQFY